MACNTPGFDNDGVLYLSKGSDIEETFPFPDSYDLTGYTGDLVIRSAKDSDTALLTVSEVATANGSVIVFDGASITVRVKADDVAGLPEDATDNNEPWVGVYGMVTTDPDGLKTLFASNSVCVDRGVVR